MSPWHQSVPFFTGKTSSIVLTCSLSHASAGWNQSDCFQWASGQVFPPYWREQGMAVWRLDQKRPSDGVGTALQKQCDGEGFWDPIWWHIPRSTAWLLLQVYYFSKGTLKIANKQFTAVKNDYEMTFNNETSVMPCEDGHHLPTVQFDFTGIGDLESKSKDSLVGKSVRENQDWSSLVRLAPHKGVAWDESLLLHFRLCCHESLDHLFNFVYLFLAVLDLCCCAGFSLIAEREGYSLVAMCGLLIALQGFSLCRARALGHAGFSSRWLSGL